MNQLIKKSFSSQLIAVKPGFILALNKVSTAQGRLCLRDIVYLQACRKHLAMNNQYIPTRLNEFVTLGDRCHDSDSGGATWLVQLNNTITYADHVFYFAGEPTNIPTISAIQIGAGSVHKMMSSIIQFDGLGQHDTLCNNELLRVAINLFWETARLIRELNIVADIRSEIAETFMQLLK